MATTQQTALQQLYVAYFNRPADPGGLAFYDANLTAGRVTMAQISADFAQSSEYQNEYDQATYAGVVDQVYQNLFGRPADATGKALYVKALNDKTMTIGEMVTWISNGAQGSDKVAFDAKVAVAAAFTEALNTPAEVTGYNEDAQAAAKALLSTIKTATQATTAVAAIDTHVAAVIKAGVEFSLETGLADLAAAQEARADFLEAFGEENDIENADEDDIEGATATATAALVSQIEDAGFADASPGVQAAMIDDQQELNADTLAQAQKNLKAAQDAVTKVTGLNNAISAAKSATEGVEEAKEAAIDAQAAFASAQTLFTGRNPTVTPGTDPVTGNTALLNKDGKVIATIAADGTMKVATGITAADYPGLAALVTAQNGNLAAQADVAAAEDAATFAQLQVELLDLEAGKLTATTFDFNLTTPAKAAAPTYAEILDELSALTAASVVADAEFAAADEDDADYDDLEQDAIDAAKAVSDFRDDIDAFIIANTTKLANNVIAAEEGSLAPAQAAFAAAVAADADLAVALDDYDSITEAAAAIKLAQSTAAALVVAEGKATTATTTYNNNVTSFEAANADVDVTLTAITDATVPATPVVLTTVAAGVMSVKAGIDVADYPGLTTMVNAINAANSANAALVVAQGAADDADVDADLIDNATVILDLAAAMTSAGGTTLAARAAALGTEGAQAAIDDLADAIEDLEAAQAAEEQLASLDKAIDAVIAEFDANDYNAPSMLGISAFGTTGSDIFVATDVAKSTITNFGRSGDDVLFIGSGFTLNTSDDLDDGVDSVLEVFFSQSGNNAVVTVETKAYGSDSGDVQTITLTGVDAADLTFANGIISL